ncbi:hypothetical protein [Pedococcus sp. P5_B7]
MLERISGYLRRDVLHAVPVPARVVYLVATGSASGFEKAVRTASSRWAGVTEPIVPISRTGRLAPWYSQVIELAAVQCLVNIDLPDDVAQRAAARTGLPCIQLRDIDRFGAPSSWTVSSPDIVAPDLESARVTRPNGRLWELVACGGLTMVDSQAAAHQGVELADSITEDFSFRYQLAGHTLLERGCGQFGIHSASGGLMVTPVLMYIARPNNLRDCWWFWNLRALGSRNGLGKVVILVPDVDVGSWLSIAAQVQSLVGTQGETRPSVALARHPGCTPERAHRIAGALGMKPLEGSKWTGKMTPASVATPVTYRQVPDLREFLVFEREYSAGQSSSEMLVTTGEATQVSITSPAGYAGRGSVLLRLWSPSIRRYPRRTFVAELILPNATWEKSNLEIRTLASLAWNLNLSLPSMDDVVERALAVRTRANSPSTPGLLAEAIDNQANDEQLLAPSVLACVGVLKTPRSKEIMRTLAKVISQDDMPSVTEFLANVGGRVERRAQTVTQVTSAGVANAGTALELLAAINWAERGLLIRCQRCKVRSFVELRAVISRPTCPACNKPEAYEADLRGPLMHYRLSALIDRAADQGVTTHIAAAAGLRKSFQHVTLALGTNLVFHDDTKAEADLFGVIDGSLVMGEVKTKVAEFTRPQILRDIEVARRLDVDTYVMAAPDAFSPQQLELCRRQCARFGLRAITLQGDVVSTL